LIAGFVDSWSDVMPRKLHKVGGGVVWPAACWSQSP